jgi:hypothetical protein
MKSEVCAAPEGECRQGQRGPADVGDHGGFASLIDHAKPDDQAQFLQSPRSMMARCHFIKESDGREARHGHNGAVVGSLSGMNPGAFMSRKYRRATTRRTSFVQTEP